MIRLLAAGLALICLVLVTTGSGLGPLRALLRPEGGGLPPAMFVEDTLPALQPLHQSDAYTPSEASRGESRLRQIGIWPLRSSWYEWVPAEIPPKAVVVLLHGTGRDGLSVLDMWRETARAHDLLLIAPNGAGQGWSTTRPARIEAIVRAATEAHGVAPTGLFLFGHSDGAVLAQAVLNAADPGIWAGAALHAGYLDAGKIGTGRNGAPLRLWLGTEDHLFSPAGARHSLQRMAAIGHPAELVLVSGHTHWFYDIGPQIAANALDWFSSLAP